MNNSNKLWSRKGVAKLIGFASVVFSSSAFMSAAQASQKVSDAELATQSGATVYVKGYCSNSNSCGTPVTCRPDPDNAAQCAEDTDLMWFTCTGDSSSKETCAYPKTKDFSCFVRVYYSGGFGCYCDAHHKSTIADKSLNTHNTCK